MNHLTVAKLIASLLTTVLFMSVLGVVFTPNPAASQSDISVAMKAKEKITLISIKNNGDIPIYYAEFKASDGNIRYIKAKDWDRLKIEPNYVMVMTENKPLTKGKNMVVLLMIDNPSSEIEWSAFGKGHELLSYGEAKSGKVESIALPNPSCQGNAACFTATVTAIVDGDTIDVNDGANTIRIRLALTNTPERGQPLYNQAVQFTADLCSVGSIAGIDEDDGQREGSYANQDDTSKVKVEINY